MIVFDWAFLFAPYDLTGPDKYIIIGVLCQIMLTIIIVNRKPTYIFTDSHSFVTNSISLY